MGKSTLLRTLSAFQPKLAGNIYIAGKELGEYTDRQMSHLISVVLTEKCDLYNMSVAELVGLGRTPYTGFWGILSEVDKAIVREAIEQTGITHLAHRMAHTLSDGERQKAMIAKALAQETPVIFLDEPTAFLDFPSKVDMLFLLKRLSHEMKKTIFLSTHDLDLALQIADKVWLMDTFSGVHIGTPEDLALTGTLEHFFVNEHLSFETDTGLFRVKYTSITGVSLEGTNARRCAMTKKALARLGFYLVGREQTEKHVIVEEKEFLLSVNAGDILHLNTLEELLAALSTTYDSGNRVLK
ncbi:iron(III) ABC transporter ATP-binding protein [gut metagenome]|uniref:Iron(III) ABC transporter ATP-binding protein n=1 Tax=gut metagenome TaxID=749906 RepID=J9GFV7_9ZZZZ